MTSGNFRSFPISSITINERQRKSLPQIEELAESIHRTGLINPIVVTSEGLLVAGERRLTACKLLGWTSISAQFVEDLDEYELQCIELEENIKRVDLSWQDEVLALEKFHSLRLERDETWTSVKTAETLGFSDRSVRQKLAVSKEIIGGNVRIAQADKLSVAINLVSRNNERKKSSALATFDEKFAAAAPANETVLEKLVPPLANLDFREWVTTYAGPKFNLIHCDFPYGINVADSPRMSASIQEHYEDSPDVYFELLSTLALAMDNVVAESAHLIFWFSMDFYEVTRFTLAEMGWKVSPFPFIWHKSDGAGIAPDPQRQPRRTYETAFFGIRGDRKITQAGTKNNSFAYPGRRGDEAIHLSEKPQPMLEHFLSMICDEYSTVLDPTCGSGNALKAATALGANSVLGIEKSKDFFDTAWIRYFDE